MASRTFSRDYFRHFQHGFLISFMILVLVNISVVSGRFIFNVHTHNYTETFHDFNQSRTRFFFRADPNNAQARLHNEVESFGNSSKRNATSEINNALSQFPSVSVNVTSSTSRRRQRQVTCMTLMWNRLLSQKVTRSMKSSACKQYQKWGEGMKKQSPWKADDVTSSWLAQLGLDAFRHHGSRRSRRQTLRQRKEYRMMTSDELWRFNEAVRQLKQTGVGRDNRYDVFVLLHQPNLAPAAHFGPAFLGWHREMLFRFENALRELDPEVTIPYWDSTLDAHLDDQADDAVTWSDEFLGTRRGAVTSGPFANFSLPININGRNTLFRGIGGARTPPPGRPDPRLMTSEHVRLLVESRDFRNTTWFVDPSFEMAHGMVHRLVSGVFGDLANSVADPLFFLHHAFIDCLWEEQRRRIEGNYLDYQSLYPTDDQALGVGVVQPDRTILRNGFDSPHHPRAEMRPFGPLINLDGLSEEYSRHYSCAQRPSCEPSHPSCNSPHLFCDMRAWRCAPKLRHGSACSRWASYEPCYDGVCCEGVCQQRCEYWTPEPPSTPNSRFYNPFWNSSFRDRFHRFPEVPSPPYFRLQAPTHPPEFFRFHEELERLALG